MFYSDGKSFVSYHIFKFFDVLPVAAVVISQWQSILYLWALKNNFLIIFLPFFSILIWVTYKPLTALRFIFVT